MSELPNGWVITNIGDVADISSGFAFPERFQGKTSGDLPFAKVRDISHAHRNNNGRLARADNYVTQSDLHDLKARPAQAGSTVFAKIGEALRLNRRVLLEVDTVLDNNCMAVTGSRRAVEPEFLYRFLTTIDLSPFAVATTVPSVRRGDVESIELHLPPLAEQRRIVAKIDSLSEKSRRARDHLNHIPRLVEKYKQAILAAAFRGELTREWRIGRHLSISIEQLESLRLAAWQSEYDRGRARGRYSPPDDIGWRSSFDIPTGWTWASIDQVACLIQYGSSAKTNEDQRGIAVLRMGNIQDGKLDLGSLKYLPEGHSEFPELLLERGDVLFNRTNSAELVGKTAVYAGEPVRASFASYLIRVRCCGLLPALLSGYVNSAYGRDWVASVVNQQVGQANVNGTKLRQLGVPVMPHEEQEEIVCRIETAFAWIDRLASETNSARALIDHLNQAILAKAFSGELVPQDPSDEPASVLLERLRADRQGAPKTERRRRARAET